MSRNLSVVEPHPSVVKTGSYIGSGIGGAGNFRRYQSSELSEGPNAMGPAALATIARPAKRVMPSGRGGAGNMYRPKDHEEPSIFQFDEELVKRRESAAPMYHIGRGGAANWVTENKPRTQRMGSSDSSASISSDRSSGSSVRRSMEGALGRLQRKLGKQ
ncbi:unnamed protein product [marine sediment metagenome]|uniref:Uncharacterized protein n=1 Tax=marine sediment metagenome TaxID=412755 RepID=X1UZA1_9ZZZZ